MYWTCLIWRSRWGSPAAARGTLWWTPWRGMVVPHPRFLGEAGQAEAGQGAGVDVPLPVLCPLARATGLGPGESVQPSLYLNSNRQYSGQ